MTSNQHTPAFFEGVIVMCSVLIRRRMAGLRNFLLGQARRVDWIAYRLDFRDARKEARELDARLKKGLAEAKAKGASQRDLEGIRGQFDAESRIIWDPIYVFDSDRLIARARRLGVRFPPYPQTYSEDSEDWYLSQVAGWSLSNAAEERLKIDIRNARRERDDEVRKWATLVFAVVGTALAGVSVFSKLKQPDLCPKNYYRNDAGECIFALQKPVTAPLVQPATVQIQSPIVTKDSQPAGKASPTSR